MQFFDLHCDTLYKATVESSSLNDSRNHISVDKAKYLEKWVQLFAIWIPDDLNGSQAKHLFEKAVCVFNREKIHTDNIQMHLAVENSSMLDSDIDNIQLLVDNNVKSVTLTWNGVNEIGGGSLFQDVGLSNFGKDVVKELEKNNIAIDLSHASDKLFYDVISLAKKPVLATHSNSRSITNVNRNLTDDQFKIIRDMKGIVGLNFHVDFLNSTPDNASIDDLLRHAEYFLNIAGEDTLAIGSDFDGATMPSDISGIQTIESINQRFIREFGENITKKIFFDNANLYFTNFDNI